MGLRGRLCPAEATAEGVWWAAEAEKPDGALWARPAVLVVRWLA